MSTTDNTDAVVAALAAGRARLARVPFGAQRDALRAEAEALAADFSAADLPDEAIVDALTSPPIPQLMVPVPDAIAEVRHAVGAVRRRPPPGHATPDGEEPWGDPIAFGNFELPPFPLNALPPTLGSWVAAEAEATQTAQDLAAMLALAVTSAAVAKKYKLNVRDDWTEPLNTYVLVSLPSGERKSTVYRDATAPLRQWERDERWRREPMLRREREERELLELRGREARTRAARADGAEREAADQEVFDAADALAASRPGHELQLVAEDVTPESVADLLHKQRGRLALFSDEGGGVFEIMRGRYQSNGRGNIDVYLKGYGGEELRVNRKVGPPIFVRSPCLVVALTVQPCVLDGLAEAPELRGRGLLARFLYAIPPARAGHRSSDPVPMPADVRAAFERTLTVLCELQESLDDDGEIQPVTLGMSEAARAEIRTLVDRVEPRLRDGGDLETVRDLGNRVAGTVARLAALLHLWRAAEEGRLASIGPVDVVEVQSATTIVLDYLVPHGLAAFGAMGADPVLVTARHLLRWIVRRNVTSFSRRDAFEGVKAHVQRAARLDEPLRVLEERGFVRRLPEPELRDRGRPAGPRYVVNPGWLASHKSQ